MRDSPSTLEQVLELARGLSALDKAKLIARLAPDLERPLRDTEMTRHRRTFRGILEGVRISEEDIAEARREMWGNFPREDI